jgi:hypothetical protein
VDSTWVQLIILALLILFNGILAGSEMALVSLRESQAVVWESAADGVGRSSDSRGSQPIPFRHPDRHHSRGFLASAAAGIGTLYYAGALTFTADTYLVTVMAIVGASQTVYQVLIKTTGLKGWVDGVGVR